MSHTSQINEISDSIARQGDEFDALNNLIEAYKSMPPIVDDDYPRARYVFEGQLYNYVNAMIDNGRFGPNTRGELCLRRANICVSGQIFVGATGFKQLRDANTARQHEWDPLNQISTAYRGNEFGGEVGEAIEEAIARLLNMLRVSKAAGKLQNLIKKLEREKLGIKGSRTTKEALAKELADVIICVDLIAMDEDVDLWAAVKGKFNETSEKVGLTTKIP